MIKNSLFSVSIIICSVRPLKCLLLLNSLRKNQLSSNDQIVIIFDTPISKFLRTLTEDINVNNKCEIIYNDLNQGLSYCRNLGISMAKNNYVIFFDDDVLLPSKTISGYKDLFANNYEVIGGPLQLPDFYKRMPQWLPEGYSSLLGIHTIQKRIWGGNFGFDNRLASKNCIQFNELLGRKGTGLQSGEESDFIEKLSRFNAKTIFCEDLIVYHCIEYDRFKLQYLIKRSFWQGRSEVRKNTIIAGIKKEFLRSISCGGSNYSYIKLFQFIVGFILYLSCCAGILWELVIKNKIYSE